MDDSSGITVEVHDSDSQNNNKPGVISANTTAAVRMRIKKQIQKCFYGASEGKGSRWMNEYSQSLRELYYYASRFSDGLKYFLFCFRFVVERLWERIVSKQSWNNCMKMVTNVSLGLSLKGDTTLVDFLVETCEKSSRLPLVRLRTYACNLAELMLLSARKVDSIAQSSNVDQDSCLSLKNILALYEVLMDREFDSNAAVRVAALRAISEVQCTSSLEALAQKQMKLPRNILQAHLRDVNYECRLAAVHLLSVNEGDTAELLLDVSLTDENESVRKASLLRLAKEVQAQKLKLESRMLLLKELFLLITDSSSSAFLRQLLNRWMCNIGKELFTKEFSENEQWRTVAPELLSLLDFHNEEELSLNTIVLSLACCRENLNMKALDCHYFIKEILYNGNRWTINSHNYKRLLDKRMESSNLPALTFWWRCIANYCKLQCRTDADLFECYYKLLPTMRTFTEFIGKFVDRIFGRQLSDGDGKNASFSLTQLLKIVPLYNQDEKSGRQAWRALLEKLLSDYEKSFSYDVISVIVRQLYQYFWPSSEDSEEALLFICDTTSSIVHHSYNPHATIAAANETISLNVLNSTASSEPITIEEAALLRCVMIINAMMKTNRYKQMCTLLLGLLDNLIEKGLIAENAECRLLSFEAMGIMTMCDKQCAYQKIMFIRDTLELVDNLKVAALNILCNYSLVYGFKTVSEWYRGNYNFGDPSSNLLHVFRASIWNKDADVCYAACRGLCQLILNKKLEFNEDVMCDLLLKAFHYGTEDQRWVKSCLDCFLNCYSSECRENQLVLINCFKRIMDGTATKAETIKTSDVDMTQFVARILSATSLQNLKNAEAKGGGENAKPPVHILLCKIILELLCVGCDYDSDLLSGTLCNLDIGDWANIEFLEEVRSRVEDAISDFEDNGTIVRNLKLFFRKLTDRLSEFTVSRKKSRNADVLYTDYDEDHDVEELISGTSRVGLRTPLTRSAAKRLNESPMSECSVEVSDSGDPGEISTADIMGSSGTPVKISERRARRCLNFLAEGSVSAVRKPLSPLKEREEEYCGLDRKAETSMEEGTK